ncbi:MAG: MucBP domain-containing protein, partial [Bacilli bacterium]
DVNDNELATSEVSTGLIDTGYTTEAKDIYGYTLTEEPENKTGLYTEDKIIVKYIYNKNIGNAEESLQKIGLETVDSVDSAFEYKITYNTSITDYVGDVNIQIIDELPYEIDVLKSSIPEVCGYENGLLVCEYNKTIISEEDSEISIDIDLVLYFVNISDEIVVNKVRSVLTYGEEELINEDSTGTKVLSGSVQVNYITDKGEVLDESVIMSGLVGTEYETSKKAFDKYYLKEVIGEETGVYTSEMTEVTYVYSLIPLPPQTGYVGNSTNYIGLIICGIFLLFWKKKIEVK